MRPYHKSIGGCRRRQDWTKMIAVTTEGTVTFLRETNVLAELNMRAKRGLDP